MTSPARSANDFAVRVAAFYAALFMLVGIQVPFFPVWLKASGLDPGETALVLAAALVVRLAAVPVAARIADRRGAYRATLIVASAAAGVGFVGVGLAGGFAGILAAYAVASFALSPVLPLTDAYALKGLRLHGRAFGPVRLWGSVAYIAGNLGAGVLVDVITARRLVWLLVAGLGIVAATSLCLRPLGTDPPRLSSAPPRRMLRSPKFLTIACAASLIQASHALYYGFSTIDWSQNGLDGSRIGALWALGVAAEVVLFAVSARLPARLDPLALVALGAAGAVVRWSVMAIDPPMWLLPPLQCLHALSFGATFLGSVQVIARMAPERQVATAQGDFATIASVGMAASTALSGLLYGAFGAHAYAVMALLAAAGGALLLAGGRILRDPYRVPRRDPDGG